MYLSDTSQLCDIVWFCFILFMSHNMSKICNIADDLKNRRWKEIELMFDKITGKVAKKREK